MDTERIPLFPLDVVLFPGRALPLHIFEPRYRIMTRQCFDRRSPFGVVLARKAGSAETGCTALIVNVLKRYEDGRSDILTVGQRAFLVVRTYDDKAYLEAEAKYLEENLEAMEPGVSAQLERLFEQCHRILYSQPAPQFEAGKNPSLAFHVAAELPLELEFRQTLLELRSEVERQRRLVARLEEWYPQLQRRERVRAKSAGNGHAKL